MLIWPSSWEEVCITCTERSKAKRGRKYASLMPIPALQSFRFLIKFYCLRQRWSYTFEILRGQEISATFHTHSCPSRASDKFFTYFTVSVSPLVLPPLIPNIEYLYLFPTLQPSLFFRGCSCRMLKLPLSHQETGGHVEEV